ncbi:unnamed protein product [Phytophthora lilii]|uniref:Unnamed protein product n=1 Tax=Phytophthora lilii TaxID=2077276 RepID=A0A9W6TGC3_9STRA|nr:unnamed protein product [Phytophthora lilii]
MEQQETQGNDVQDAAQTTQLRVNGNGIAAGDKADDVERAQAEAAEDDGEESEEEEEALVVLELCDFKNHPLLDDYSSATLEVCGLVDSSGDAGG